MSRDAGWVDQHIRIMKERIENPSPDGDSGASRRPQVREGERETVTAQLPTPADQFAETRAALTALLKSLGAAKRSQAAASDSHVDAARRHRRTLQQAISRLGAEADLLKEHERRLLSPDDTTDPSLFDAARIARGGDRGRLISQMIGDARLFSRELTIATTSARLERKRIIKRASAGPHRRSRTRRYRAADERREEH